MSTPDWERATGVRRPPHPDYPYGPHITVMTTPPPPRQSCAVHALLLLTTAGIGNVAYAIWHWHTHRYAR